MPDYGNNGPKVANNEWNGLQPVHFCDGIPYALFHAADKFCQNQCKVCSISTSITYV